LGLVNVATAAGSPHTELTSLRFGNNPLHLAVGTSSGQVLLYDIRSSCPLVIKDHLYGSPIVDIKFMRSDSSRTTEQLIATCDRHIVKIWDPKNGKPYTSIQSPQNTGEINDMCIWPGSGLIMLAMEAPAINTFFLPSLGPAPKWCSFLEDLTQELDGESNNNGYADFIFLTSTAVENIGLMHLVGTSLIKAYMHGFLIDSRLYKKIENISEPYSFINSRTKTHLREYPKAETTTPPNSNKSSYVKTRKVSSLLPYQKQNDKMKNSLTTVIEDDRFKAMFIDSSFNIDENSSEYMLLNSRNPTPTLDNIAKRFTEI
jgi:ribosome biogenesis protein ENP2